MEFVSDACDKTLNEIVGYANFLKEREVGAPVHSQTQ